jgi:hypothetical protein
VKIDDWLRAERLAHDLIFDLNNYVQGALLLLYISVLCHHIPFISFHFIYYLCIHRIPIPFCSTYPSSFISLPFLFYLFLSIPFQPFHSLLSTPLLSNLNISYFSNFTPTLCSTIMRYLILLYFTLLYFTLLYFTLLHSYITPNFVLPLPFLYFFILSFHTIPSYPILISILLFTLSVDYFATATSLLNLFILQRHFLFLLNVPLNISRMSFDFLLKSFSFAHTHQVGLIGT